MRASLFNSVARNNMVQHSREVHMPRTSAAAAAARVHVLHPRLNPPDTLDADERVIWNRLVGSVPQGWFDGGTEMLTRLVVLLVGIEVLEEQLRKLRGKKRKTAIDNDDYIDVVDRHAKLSAQAERMLNSCRLTPKSRSTAEGASLQIRKPASTKINPWEIRGSDASAEEASSN
jgi:hypothetical protein